MTKEILTENEDVDDIENTEDEVVNSEEEIEDEDEDLDETAALDSLKPGSNDDSRSKFERIVSMIGAAHAMRSDEFEKWHNETMARAEEIGHGPGIPDGAAERNRRSVDMKSVKEAVASDVQKMLADESGLTEEFKKKAGTLFEAALEARITLYEAQLEDAFAGALTEAIEQISDELTAGVEKYLDYAADTWMEDNKVAVESSLRNEIATEFISGLKKLFIESNINIPEEQVELVDTMAEKIQDLESRLSEAITETTTLRDALEDSQKKEVVDEVCEGLTLAEAEKLKELAENIEYDNADELMEKLTTIKQSQFVKGTKPSTINEDLEFVDEDNQPKQPKTYNSPEMKVYAEAISRSIRK